MEYTPDLGLTRISIETTSEAEGFWYCSVFERIAVLVGVMRLEGAKNSLALTRSV